MKHTVTLEFPTPEKLIAFHAAAGLSNCKIDDRILDCVITFKQVELAKEYAGKVLVAA